MAKLLQALRRESRGQGAIELAGVLPVVLMVIVLLVQGFLAMTAVSDVRDAARDGARAEVDGRSAHAAAMASLPSWIENPSVSSCGRGCVRVRGQIPLGIPGVVTVIKVPVQAEATFRPSEL